MKTEENIVEKYIIRWSYWLGVIALALAFLFRTIDVVNPKITLIPTKGHPIGYNTLMHGALLFFGTTIASACYASFKSHGSQTLLEKDAFEHDALDEILRDFVNSGCARENAD